MEEVRVLREEIKWLNTFLLYPEYPKILDQQLQQFMPFPEDFLKSVNDYLFYGHLVNQKDLEYLLWSEVESPFLLNRDLASIALIRQGQLTQSRIDRVCGLMMYSGEGSPVAIEAALAFAQWRSWNQELSKWWNWKSFLDVIDQGLIDDELAPWCALAYFWGFQKQGGQAQLSDASFQTLKDSLFQALKVEPNRHVRDFKMTRTLALNEGRVSQEKALVLAPGPLSGNA